MFGKNKRRPGDLLIQLSVFLDENNEESTWWSIIEIARNPDVDKEEVVEELFYLKMFAVELFCVTAMIGFDVMTFQKSIENQLFMFLNVYFANSLYFIQI